ncbi:MAG: hypothetical protein MUF51_11155 [Vicinamibacteria bacterium]|jgi:hypothetical protein|nr:hypothetical protein [Vicinamibacteria bacterium]
MTDTSKQAARYPTPPYLSILPLRRLSRVGTRSGLARFDSVRCTLFDDRQPDPLKDGEVFALSEGDDGALWIGTRDWGVKRIRDDGRTALSMQQGLAVWTPCNPERWL